MIHMKQIDSLGDGRFDPRFQSLESRVAVGGLGLLAAAAPGSGRGLSEPRGGACGEQVSPGLQSLTGETLHTSPAALPLGSAQDTAGALEAGLAVCHQRVGNATADDLRISLRPAPRLTVHSGEVECIGFLR